MSRSCCRSTPGRSRLDRSRSRDNGVPSGQSTLRLIVSSDVANEVDLPVVLALHLVDEDPASLLAVRVGEHGWARAMSIEPIMRRRLVERLGTADLDTMNAVNAALRAVQDL